MITFYGTIVKVPLYELIVYNSPYIGKRVERVDLLECPSSGNTDLLVCSTPIREYF